MEKIDLKISLFLPSLCGGGAERVVVNLVKEFVKRGINVDLVLADAEGPYLREICKEAKIFDLKSPRVLFVLPKLVRYFRKEKPEVVISSLTHMNVVTILAKKIAISKSTVVVREDTTLSLASSSSLIKDCFVRLLARLFYPMADAIVAVSNGVKEDLVQNFHISPDKIKVIYNPIINNEIFENAKEPVLHPWFTSKSTPIIIAVGRQTNLKDFKTLIKAFYLVREETEAYLVILGEGEERENLEKLAKDLGISNDVYMPGFVNNPYKYMSKASVFVLSSIYEGLPTVLVEALALGCPVVSTDCPSGPREILENGKYGKLVPVGDHIAMSQAIEEILAGKVHYEVPESILEQYTNEFSVNQYIKVLVENGIYKYE